MPWPDDTTQPNQQKPVLPNATPVPPPDSMGAQNSGNPDMGGGDLTGADTGKIDTPLGPVTAPHPQVVAQSGGLGGYLKGVVGRLPKALAIMESSYGNSAPLQAIQQDEARQQQAIQQQFENTVTAQRENRAQQLYKAQYDNFQSEIQYRNVQKQLEQQKIVEQQQLQTAREIIQNNASKPDDIQRAHQILQSYGVEKPEPEQYMQGANGQVFQLPKTGAVSPIATPVMQKIQDPMYMLQNPEANTRMIPFMGQGKAPTGSAEDERYRQITSAQLQNKQVSPEDASWAKAYKAQKEIGPNVSAGPRWAQVQTQKERLEMPYMKDYQDSEKIATLADLVMKDVERRGGKVTGPEYMQMLTYHMAGTVGSVKGAKSGIETLKEHVNARPYDQSLAAMYNAATTGGNVSIEQAREWANLAHSRRDVMFEQAKRMNQVLGSNLDFSDIAPGYSMPQEVKRPTKPPKGAEVVNMTGEGE